MTKRVLSHAQFDEMMLPLIGLPVSRTWCGHGSAIFLELGALTQQESKQSNGAVRVRHVGEATVMIQWSWRVEKLRSIAFGSWNSKRQIENGIAKLQGSTVESIQLEGRLPEIVVGLSGDRWVHSFMTTQSQPEWAVLWNRQVNATQHEKWIHCERAKVVFAEEV